MAVSMADKFDTFTLPPTQQLVLEVLAARLRLGEPTWTFSTRMRAALEALEAGGWIGWKEGVVHATANVWLTEAGRHAALDPNYRPPTQVNVTPTDQQITEAMSLPAHYNPALREVVRCAFRAGVTWRESVQR